MNVTDREIMRYISLTGRWSMNVLTRKITLTNPTYAEVSGAFYGISEKKFSIVVAQLKFDYYKRE